MLDLLVTAWDLRHVRRRGSTLLVTRTPDATVTIRPPRLDDFPAWREARERSRASIEPFWHTEPGGWEEQHSRRRWARGLLERRRAGARGSLLGWVVEVDGVLAGEVELSGIDRDESTGELGGWVDDLRAGQGLGLLAFARVRDVALDDVGLDRVTAPVAVVNLRAQHVFERLGFVREAVMAAYLDVGGGPTDHVLMAVVRADRPAPLPTASWSGPVARTSATPRTRVPVGERFLLRAEAARYVVSTLKAAARGRGVRGRTGTDAAGLVRLAAPSGAVELVPRASLAPSATSGRAHAGWEVRAAGAVVGLGLLRGGVDLSVATEVVLTTPLVQRPADELSTVVALLSEVMAEQGPHRICLELPVGSGPDLRRRLATAGFDHEGDVRRGAGGPQELWAHVVEAGQPR